MQSLVRENRKALFDKDSRVSRDPCLWTFLTVKKGEQNEVNDQQQCKESGTDDLCSHKIRSRTSTSYSSVNVVKSKSRHTESTVAEQSLNDVNCSFSATSSLLAGSFDCD